MTRVFIWSSSKVKYSFMPWKRPFATARFHTPQGAYVQDISRQSASTGIRAQPSDEHQPIEHSKRRSNMFGLFFNVFLCTCSIKIIQSRLNHANLRSADSKDSTDQLSAWPISVEKLAPGCMGASLAPRYCILGHVWGYVESCVLAWALKLIKSRTIRGCKYFDLDLTGNRCRVKRTTRPTWSVAKSMRQPQQMQPCLILQCQAMRIWYWQRAFAVSQFVDTTHPSSHSG